MCSVEEINDILIYKVESGGGGGGNSLIKVGTDVRARALGISGVSICPDIKFWEVNFEPGLKVVGNF